MKIKIKKLHEDAKLPTYAHDTDAGFDFYTLEDITIENLSTFLIRTGIAMEIPEGYSLEIYPRSGLSYKFHNYIANNVGLVDSGYRNEVVILFRNSSFNQRIQIPKHTKIAQGVIRKFEHVDFKEVDELSDSDRGQNGLGSTGMK